MTYNFLTIDRLSPARIASALAACLHVASSEVDVADTDNDQDERNWDAPVLCDYSDAQGHISQSLDIYIQDSVRHHPSEAELALAFSAATNTVTLYPAEEQIPSAYWLATPDRLVTRVRLLSSDDEAASYSIDAAEAYIPQLPDVRIIQLPEIIREYPVPAPTTSAFVAAVNSLAKSTEGVAAPRFPAELESAVDQARAHLSEWERLTRRMASRWQPTGHYPADLYHAALRSRDQVDQLTAGLPEPISGLLRESLNQLDSEFKTLTQSDNGHEIAKVTGTPQLDLPKRSWWWQRRPIELPW
ncbi:hypothetical protein [Streptomyces hesseae]|uniref:PE-PGRS family protein n=1 Tax=Streptomyces hesseae TaxID=3075519 RepID=A0ABU2STQ6_9ACTN|nr:hypothetical protein [Streptomyces sp. DSM 40473]MDT0452393.1 hypothetical protein [Streptomyces sp. DSM 40473]